MGGFISSDPEHPVTQPDSALVAVVIGVTVVPALITFAGVLMTLKYDLTADRIAAATGTAETTTGTTAAVPVGEETGQDGGRPDPGDTHRAGN